MYIDLLLRWNARVNLTAIRRPEEIVTRHFGESFFLARHLFPRNGGEVRVIDIGSGAGFPGLPLKIWKPSISLTLVESNHKKAAFLREVARALTFTNVNILAERAETLLAEGQGASPSSIPFDVVTLRAVEHFVSILPTAAALVATGGRLALLVGSSQLASLKLPAETFHPLAPIPVPESRSRVVAILVRRP